MAPLKTIIIYAKQDLEFRDGLEIFLTRLIRFKRIEVWSDVNIDLGEHWTLAFQNELKKAELILMLISIDSYTSKHIQDVALVEAKKRHDNKEAVLVPILVRHCPPFESIKDLKMLPLSLKPISVWASQDQAYTHIVEEIEVHVENLLIGRREAEKKIQLAEIAAATAAAAAATLAHKQETQMRVVAEVKAKTEEGLKVAQIVQTQKVTQVLEVSQDALRRKRIIIKVISLVSAFGIMLTLFLYFQNDKLEVKNKELLKSATFIGAKSALVADLEAKLSNYEHDLKESAKAKDTLTVMRSGIFALITHATEHNYYRNKEKIAIKGIKIYLDSLNLVKPQSKGFLDSLTNIN